MTVIVGASAHGSPGVSTALQLLASLWPQSGAVPVVVEADLGGGVAAARFGLSLTPGFVTLAESLRKAEKPPLLDHAQRLPSGVACVAISPSATAASAQVRSAGPFLGSYLSSTDHPVFVDAGSVHPDGRMTPVLTAADLVMWFVRPTREELLVLRHRLSECAQPKRSAIVLVGGAPYNAEQVHEALGVEVIHTLADDRRAGAAVNLGGDDRYLRRSSLARSCGHLVSVLASELETPAPVVAGGAAGPMSGGSIRAQSDDAEPEADVEVIDPVVQAPTIAPASKLASGLAPNAVVVSSGPTASLESDDLPSDEHGIAGRESSGGVASSGPNSVFEGEAVHGAAPVASDDELHAARADGGKGDAAGGDVAQLSGRNDPGAVENVIKPGDLVPALSEGDDPIEVKAEVDEPLVVWTPDS